MNELLQNIHVLVFIKILKKKIGQDLEEIITILDNPSKKEHYKPHTYDSIINWIENYPSRGIMVLVNEKEKALE